MTEEKETPLRMVTPDGRWVVEVTQRPDGQFYASVTLDGTHILESLETFDSDKLITWTGRQMRDVMRRQTNEQP